MSAKYLGGLAPGPYQFPIAARQSEICICISCLVIFAFYCCNLDQNAGPNLYVLRPWTWKKGHTPLRLWITLKSNLWYFFVLIAVFCQIRLYHVMVALALHYTINFGFIWYSFCTSDFIFKPVFTVLNMLIIKDLFV